MKGDVPPKLKQNCSHMVLYPPTTKNHANLIQNLFNKLGPHEFLFVDKEHKTFKKFSMN